MFKMKEIIGAENRCTNLSLSTIGICESNPVMRFWELIKSIENAFGKDKVYEFIKFYRNDRYQYVIHGRQDYPKGMPEAIPAPLTINKFSQYIITNKNYGHYIVNVDKHALAIHLLSNNKFYIVDNEEKFLSRRQIFEFLKIEMSGLDQIFKTFLMNNEKPEKVMEV